MCTYTLSLMLTMNNIEIIASIFFPKSHNDSIKLKDLNINKLYWHNIC